MKIGLFTDAHYSSAKLTCGKRFNSESLRKIREAYRFFEAQKCELIVFLGDLTDTEDTHEQELEKLREAAEVMRACPVPTACMMGNHDAFDFTEEEFYAELGEEFRPNDRVLGGKRLMFLDACYFKSGKKYAPGDSDWTDTYYPFADRLKQTLRDGVDTVVFLHQNIDPEISEDHCLYNAAEIRKILEESGCVRTVYQGHYHPGKETVHNGIRYITLPAMCEREEGYWVMEI